MVPTAVWGPGGERTGHEGRMQASEECPDRGEPQTRGPGPTSAGPRLLDDVFDQPVDPLVQCQAPEE